MSLKLKLIFTQKHTRRNWKQKFLKKISYRDSMAKQPHKGHKPPTISTFWSKLQIRWNVITLTYPEFQIFFSNRFLYLKNISQPQQQKMSPHNTLAHKRLLTFSCFELAARTEDEGGRGSMRAAEESHTDLLTRPFYARRPHWCVVSTVVETYQIPGYRAGPTGWLETGAGRNP